MVTKKELSELLDKIIDYNLEINSEYWKLKQSDLLGIYNGIGPDSFPDYIRNKLSQMLELLLPAVLIHDIDFYFSDCTPKSFYESNNRFYRNIKKIIKHNYSPYSFRYWLYMYYATNLRYFVMAHGWSSWIA